MMSYTFNRQPHFKAQPEGQLVGWIYGLFTDVPGDYVKKPMRRVPAGEICMEWLYHLGVPVAEIADLAEHSAKTVPVMMPYITAFFMPREKGDRPNVVPDGAVNFAFLGQFAETARDTIFTTEYSIRTGMEAVYSLLDNRPRCAGGLGQPPMTLRDLGERQCCPARRPQTHGHGPWRSRKAGSEGAAEEGPRHGY